MGDAGLKRKISEYLTRLTVLTNTFKINSIQSIITLSFTCITILSISFVGITLYNKFSEAAEKNASSNIGQIIDQVSLNVEYYLEGMIEVSNLISVNLKDDSIIDKKESLNEIFLTTYKMRKDIVTLAVLSDNGELVSGIPNTNFVQSVKITEQEWFKKALEEPGKLHILPPHIQNLFRGRRPWVVSLSKGASFIDSGKSRNVVSVVDMNFSVIEKLCQRVNLGKRGYIYIVDNKGNIIYHPQQEIVYAGLKTENIEGVLKRSDGGYTENYAGEQRFVTIKTVNYADWKIVGISYMDEIIATSKEINNFVIYILIFGVIFVFSVSIFISSRISQPIKKLEKSMKEVENGVFDIYVDVKGEDEVKQLSRSFNLMILRIKQLMNQIIMEQESKRKTELKALQAQINPHFLYNTLDSIVWMAENGRIEGVITMVSALAKLFRISISKGEEVITVKDELEHANSYLVIQQIRYADKFDFEIEAQPQVLCHKTLKLILQPLIENAIYHGIEKTVDKGRIKITASIKDDRILLQVIDDGIGITSNILKKLLFTETQSEISSGVGVKNVHNRIQLYYGKQYGLDIESELDEGTTVNIWLPLNDMKNGGMVE